MTKQIIETSAISVFSAALKSVQDDRLNYLATFSFLVVSHDGYWGRGETIEAAAKTCSREGASRNSTASVLLILGDKTPEINQAGYVIRDAGSHSIKIIERIRLGALIGKEAK
jgi:hypothetical protein